MKTGRLFFVVALFVVLGALAGMSQTSKLPQNGSGPPFTARFEHLAFNVPDPQAIVRWYTKCLGMKVVRADGPPAYLSFIADSGMHVMLEFQHQGQDPLFNPSSVHHMALHIAFNTPDIVQTQKSLLAAGATIADSMGTLGSGDRVVTLRDPWGFALQFVQRQTPMLSREGQYLEHIAINTEDSRIRATWYSENLGFTVIRVGTAPSYAIFTSDAGSNLMLELYHFTQYPVQEFRTINPFSMHFGIMANDIAKAQSLLMKAGATMVEMHNTSQGDSVLVLRDPWGLPLHLLKRVNPMLK